MEFIVEEDLVVGTVPLVPLEPLESLELFGVLSTFEPVFLRRNSLKKGIVTCRCPLYYARRSIVSDCLRITSEFMEKGVGWGW